MKLFTIGDSISQGFMSGGAAKPDLSYTTLLARALGDPDYTYLQWQQEHHLKVDLELVLRTLEGRYGANIRGPIEWPLALSTINSVLDTAEDYFERKGGKLGLPVPGGATSFHNVAVEGMDVADSWLVTPNVCKSVIHDRSNKAARSDSLLGMASDSFYRNAYRVLNPGGTATEPAYGEYSALKWLDHHAKHEGIENTVLWLGANNALGTVISLRVNQTPGDGEPLRLTRLQRQKKKWNLWHPDDFRAEYKQMLAKVDASMRANTNARWNVFVGNVPLVTIAPITRGLGGHREVVRDGRKALYFQYYTYFPITSVDLAESSGFHLKFQDALYIDDVIGEFNRIIAEELSALNTAHGRKRYHLVDVSQALSDLAWKRNKGKPPYALPPELKFVYPPLNTKYYHANRQGRIEGGGYFSLDGIHPSAAGQGIIAREFLDVMKGASAAPPEAALNWSQILKSDTLRNKPIRLMSEIYEHERLLRFVTDAIRLLKD